MTTREPDTPKPRPTHRKHDAASVWLGGLSHAARAHLSAHDVAMLRLYVKREIRAETARNPDLATQPSRSAGIPARASPADTTREPLGLRLAGTDT